MQEKKVQKQIFISHSHEDKAYAETLKQFLVNIGVPNEGIFNSSTPENSVVESIDDEIFQAMQTSKVDFVLLSDSFYESVWCSNELGAIWFKSRSKLCRRIFIALPWFSDSNIKGIVSDKDLFYRLDNSESTINLNSINKIIGIVAKELPDLNLQTYDFAAIHSYASNLEKEWHRQKGEHVPIPKGMLYHERTLNIGSSYYNGPTADVVGIGAINFDFIFKLNEGVGSAMDAHGHGDEGLEGGYGTIMRRILQDRRLNHPYFIQLGGASFNGLKVINGIREQKEFPRLAYVGVTGKIPPEIQERFQNEGNLNEYITNKLSFLDIKDWIFSSDKPSGLGFFELQGGHRSGDIGPGVNDELVENLTDKLQSTGTDRNAFVKFLAAAQWVHISSLANFDQFLIFVDAIEQAKKINRALIVSFDPGSKYMKNKIIELSKMLYLSDYVFLSKTEYGKTFKIGDSADIESVFNTYGNSNANIIVSEKLCETQWIQLIDGKVNDTVSIDLPIDATVLNDVGSGGAFAGGFIYALLTSQDSQKTKHAIDAGMKQAAKWVNDW